jgi:nucleoside-diphosphate-sugar epimerase
MVKEMKQTMKTFLITGGAGYIGTVLTDRLLALGHKVICLDRCFFGEEKVSDFLRHPAFRLVKEDIRFFDPSVLSGVDIVVDMASLSNDPVGELDEVKTHAINAEGRLRVCKLSRDAGVKRYILTSSCSVYGFSDKICLETSAPNPLTTYAKCNYLAEACLEMAQGHFCVSVLRLGTVFGLSRRMRFDLVVNGMVLSAIRDGMIEVCGQGTQYRPFVHVIDVANAITKVASAHSEIVGSQIFNVGFNKNNYCIRDLAAIIQKALPIKIDSYLSQDDPDTRSYQVDFEKYVNTFEVKPKMSIEDGALEVWAALDRGDVFDSLDTITVKWYKYLIDAQRVLRSIELNGIIL